MMPFIGCFKNFSMSPPSLFFFAILKCQIHFMISQYTSHNLGPQVGKLQPAFKRFPDFCLADEATETERSPR